MKTNCISIVIPVFNVEEYIRACLDSVLAQRYSNFEVIMVDDGSEDNSGKICDEYASKDARFISIHIPHTGVGYARNLAMERMTGEYCFYLDPDDVIESFTLELLLNELILADADIALGISRNFNTPTPPKAQDEKVVRVFTGHKDICEHVIFDKNDLKPMELKNTPSQVNYEFFSSLYKTQILKEYNIQFLPITYGEDTYVCFKYLLHSKKAITVSVPVYWHRRNPTSTTFRYHEFYLSETKEYYAYYFSLFEDLASEYVERVRIGLDGQYVRRCMSAIERELFMSPKERKTSEMCNTIAEICEDEKFKQWFKISNINKYLSSRYLRFICYCIKCHIGFPVILVHNFLKRKKDSHK